MNCSCFQNVLQVLIILTRTSGDLLNQRFYVPVHLSWMLQIHLLLTREVFFLAPLWQSVPQTEICRHDLGCLELGSELDICCKWLRQSSSSVGSTLRRLRCPSTLRVFDTWDSSYFLVHFVMWNVSYNQGNTRGYRKSELVKIETSYRVGICTPRTLVWNYCQVLSGSLLSLKRKVFFVLVVVLEEFPLVSYLHWSPWFAPLGIRPTKLAFFGVLFPLNSDPFYLARKFSVIRIAEICGVQSWIVRTHICAENFKNCFRICSNLFNHFTGWSCDVNYSISTQPAYFFKGTQVKLVI